MDHQGNQFRATRIAGAACAFLAFLGMAFIGSPATLAQEDQDKEKPKCDKVDEYGACDFSDSGGPSDPGIPPEPPEGTPWTEERFSLNCADSATDSFDSCAELDPCEEGPEYTHRHVLLRDWTFTGGQWIRQSDWYDATPWLQCRQAQDEITEEQVRRAVERFGMKSGKIQAAPPGGKTLVDLETIVWTEQGPYEFELDLAGTTIELMATPEQYHWNFGDGNTAQYDTPGVAYAKSRPMSEYHTHEYDQTGEFDVDLTIDYNVRWNAGNGWQSITDTIPSEPAGYDINVVEKRNRLRDGN